MHSDIKAKTRLGEAGVTYLELLISMAIGVLVLGGGIYVFTKNEKVMRDQNAKTTVMGATRIGLNTLSREIQGAGYGVPVGQGIQVIQTNPNSSITFRQNINDVTANVVANVAGGSSAVTVDAIPVDSNNNPLIVANDTIVIYDLREEAPNPPSGNPASETLTISSIAGTTINVTPNIVGTWDSTYPVIVSKVSSVVIAYDAGNQRVTRTVGGATIPLVNNVTNFEFTFTDENDVVTTVPANVRKIKISMTVADPDHAGAYSQLDTIVNIRNMRT